MGNVDIPEAFTLPVKLPTNLQDKLLKYFYSKSKLKGENYQNLKNDYDVLSIQRNFKILGIFIRLSKRDNKSTYLKYLPHIYLEILLDIDIFHSKRLLLRNLNIQ